MKSWTLSIIGIAAIAVLQWHAANKGLNGIALTTAIGAIAGLAGYRLGAWIKHRKDV